MNLIVLYLLKVNALLVVFWLFYRLFLRKETFYNSIRWYFISSLLLSLVFPLITYTKTVIIEQTAVFNDADWENTILPETMALQPEPAFWETITWQSVVLYVLLAVSICCVVKSLYQIIKLYISIKKLPVLNNSQIKVADHQQNIYSFYQWIVVPENKLSAADLEMILAHEKIHLNQKHTFDLIFIELVSAVFWFNPLVKKLQKDINTNLEFIVDEKMIALYDPVLYQKSLLNEHCNYTLKYINAFNTSDLKKRIIQLNTQKSKNMKKLKFLVAAPVLVTFFALFQIETVAQIQTIEVQEISDEETSFIVKENFTKEDFEKLTKKLKDEFDIDFVINEIKYKNNNIVALNYLIRNKDLKISTSVSSDKNIDPFMIVVHLSDSKPFSIEKYSEKAKYYLTVDNEKDPDFVITKEEWKDKSWIEKVSKNQKTIFLIDGKQSSETEVRRLMPDEIFTINVHKDEKTIKKYDPNADTIVLIKTKKQIKNENFNQNQLSEKEKDFFMLLESVEKDLEILKNDRKTFDKIASKFPIVVNGVLLNKNELKNFNTSLIQSVHIDASNPDKGTVVNLSTKDDDNSGNRMFSFKIADENNLKAARGFDFNKEGSKKINGKNATLEELKQHIDAENKKKDSLFVVKKAQIQKKNDEVTYVTLKGIGSVSNKNIVYIVDGKETKAEDLSKINPDNIERIDVLKDRDKIKIYGSKAKDGVIIVTTKSKKEVSLQQKAEALKARELAMQKRKQVINESKEKILQRKIERENLRKELTTKKDEIQKNVKRRKKELEKLKQEQEKSRKNHKYVTVSNKGDSKLLEKDYETVNDIFKDLKDIKKIEDENIKITSISASITREDGTKIEIAENY